jgi:hypothetical protein
LIELWFRRVAPAFLIARRRPPMTFVRRLRLNSGEKVLEGSPPRRLPARAIFLSNQKIVKRSMKTTPKETRT